MKYIKICFPCMILGVVLTLIIMSLPLKSLSLKLLDQLPIISHLFYKNQERDIHSKITQFETRLTKQSNNPNIKYLQNTLRENLPANFNKHYISNTQDLYTTLNAINTEKSANNILILDDGIYHIASTIVIKRPNTFIISFSGDPLKTILRGNGMIKSSHVVNLLTVQAPGFLLDGITLKEVSHHLIQIKGEKGANFPIIRNCVLQDAYQQLIKVTTGKKNTPSENGIIENCLFEYSAGVGPNYYIGGIDAHGVTNWLIHKNTFKYIASPRQRISEYAIHLWGNAQNNIVDSNIIIDSDRGIGFGMGNKKGDKFSNFAGVISNNIILHTDNGHPFADTGICLENSPKTLVDGNYIYLEHDYNRAIEYRFVGSQQITIQNNYVNKDISSRNGGQAELIRNNTDLDMVDFLIKMNEVLSAKTALITPKKSN